MSATSYLNSKFTTQDFLTNANKAFLSKSLSRIIDDVEFSPVPFSHFTFSNFIGDEDYLNKLKDEIDMLEFKKKDSDLYKFQQSQDLKSVDSPNIQALKNVIYKDFKQILQNITHIQLNEDVDLFAAKYDYTDVLLCHDDQSEGRRLAFILYLTPENWLEEYGGQLGLFSLNEQNLPDTISQQISPKWNQLVLFEVSDKSYHQVEEIKVPGKNRLTISGWLHGAKPLLLHLPSVNFPFELFPPGNFEENGLYDWVNPRYLLDSVQDQIQCTFEKTSEINLTSFLNEDKYGELLNALDSLPHDAWELKGPRFKRNYLVIKPSILGHPAKSGSDEDADPLKTPTKKVSSEPNGSDGLSTIRQCARLFSSEAMFLILANMTGLSLHPLALANSSQTAQKDEAGAQTNASCAGGGGESNTSSQDDRSPDRSGMPNRRKASTNASLRNKGRNRDNDNIKAETTTPLNAEPNQDSTGDNNNSNQSSTQESGPMVDEGILVDDPPSGAEGNPSEDADDFGTRFHYEICKFRPGDYTLLNDTSNELEQCSLNLNLYLGCEEWDPEFGGQTVYIDQEEDDELLNINPSPNSLALVYNDQGVAHFIKYINHKCTLGKNKRKSFYQLFFNYFESPDTRCD